LIVVWGSGQSFPIAQGTLPWQPILGQNLQKTFIQLLAFLNGLENCTMKAAMITLYRVEIRQACRAGKITKQQFIHSVNSDGSQTANIIFDIFYVT